MEETSQLQRELRQGKPFRSRGQEVTVALLKTADLVRRAVSRVLEPYDITPQQYNVLRILRGAGEPLPVGEIADRMIAREPDMTRLLDRLETRGLASRSREQADRRVVLVRITAAGRKLLATLDPQVVPAHRRQLGHMTERELKQLIALLERAREGIAKQL